MVGKAICKDVSTLPPSRTMHVKSNNNSGETIEIILVYSILYIMRRIAGHFEQVCSIFMYIVYNIYIYRMLDNIYYIYYIYIYINIYYPTFYNPSNKWTMIRHISGRCCVLSCRMQARNKAQAFLASGGWAPGPGIHVLTLWFWLLIYWSSKH